MNIRLTQADDVPSITALLNHEIEHNTALLRVGASFAELSQSVFRQPDECI